ncbi:hypothetical protein CU102_03430 [Phyllobacterium brassicacearum]|uniref:Uncharacterized protein n=1 Tax=Phyllobacterium brassicacearum TaxID=314235 RepID=A0A2P7BUK9_9HYPH|nr:hypothetical protein [Phyllobacterium brassicacearum]PSH70158.1 hypothetical protein CU102_03430 [Phyllobacterium brassicacearum]TDQ33967.1 hypothetical protein DEV91_104170 [Phyllobacterium brassicacearum]
MLYHRKTLYICLKFQQPRPSTGARPADAAIVEAMYLAEVDMQFDDTRAARIHRKEEARSKVQSMQYRSI